MSCESPVISGQPVIEIRDGYLDRLSAFPGDSVSLYLNASMTGQYQVKLYDVLGNIVFQTAVSVYPQVPPSATAYEQGFGYQRSIQVQVPRLASGIYLWENKIPMVVKARRGKIVVLYPSNTAAAYNGAGGKSLYGSNSTEGKAATTVSFRRPCGLESFSDSFLVWMARQSDDVRYITDLDMDNYSEIDHAALLIIIGHSEYWTYKARRNFDRFVASGKDVMILSGNTMWWQVRYSKSRDQLICYRKAEDDSEVDSKLKTINWEDPLLNYPIIPSIGASFSNAGYGDKPDKGWDGYRLANDSPLLKNTGLRVGDTLMLQSRETDGAPLSTFEDGVPVLNAEAMGFFKTELVGYDRVWRANTDGVMTWIAFQRAPSSGIVINVASTNWCAQNGIGTNLRIGIITRNMIDALINKEQVFSNPSRPGVIAAVIE